MTVCSVPFCTRHTTKVGAYAEWVCNEHWKGLPKERRQAYNRAKRRWQKTKSPEDAAACDRLWRRMKTIAVNRALGLR